MKFNCPHCQQSLESDEPIVGATVECPACGKPFVVESSDENIIPPQGQPELLTAKTTAQGEPSDANLRRSSFFKILIGVLAVLAALAGMGALFFAYGGRKDDASFLKNLEKGLEARWELTNFNKEQKGNSRAFVKAELNAIGDLSAYTFQDEKLKGYAEAYARALQAQLDAVAFKQTDVSKFNELWHEGYVERLKLHCRFVEEYGLKVGSKYEDILEDSVAQGRQLRALHIDIQLGTPLPVEKAYKNANGYPYTKCLVTNFTFKVICWDKQKADVAIIISGTKTYDVQGDNLSRGAWIGWKLFDSEGMVEKSGNIHTVNLCVSEQFKAEERINGLEVGIHKLELLNVSE